ncbi:hypothetical protein GCM10010278_63070 [Streptomyces melanogenes]|nr:hypothetical protein GCM10010278_63070 [Streptomyces melanogenes]
MSFAVTCTSLVSFTFAPVSYGMGVPPRSILAVIMASVVGMPGEERESGKIRSLYGLPGRAHA